MVRQLLRPVILLLAALMIGINVGVGIIISRYFGQKNEELMRRAFVNSLYLGLFLSAGMMVLGLTFSGTILRWMGTPEGPLQEATAYLEISFITMICPLMYYLFSSAFRGLGDSQTALYCLIVSVLSNIGLDVLFVAVFRWGVAGSAWATALAQALSAVVAASAALPGDRLENVAAACGLMKQAGEIAARQGGPGSFIPAFLDALYQEVQG